MSQPPGPLGSTLSETFSKVLEFAANNSLLVPAQGVDQEPVEAEVMKADGAIRVRATGEEITAVEFGESFRTDPNAMASQLVQALNEAMATARRDTMEQFAGMPTNETVRSNLASLQSEVLASYRTEMARLDDLTSGIGER